MKKYIQINLLALFLLFTTLSVADISKEAVKNSLEKFQTLIINLNEEELSKVLHSDVSISIYFSRNGSITKLESSKKQYLQQIKDARANYENYKTTSSNVKIDLAGSKAIVSSDINESMTYKGKKVTSTSREVFVLEDINGKLLITEITGYILEVTTKNQ